MTSGSDGAESVSALLSSSSSLFGAGLPHRQEEETRTVVVGVLRGCYY